MPTGYTAGVATGEITSFNQFALNCARNFGALVHMREDDSGVDIYPDKVASYHADRIASAKDEIVRIGKMTKTEWQAAADAQYAGNVAAREHRALERATQEQRYRNMAANVGAWMPPTADHEALKKFMLEQLESSINFDCRGIEDPSFDGAGQSGEQWYWSRISSLSRDITYHEGKLREETERVNRNNRWVDALRNSLPPGN